MIYCARRAQAILRNTITASNCRYDDDESGLLSALRGDRAAGRASATERRHYLFLFHYTGRAVL